MLGRVLTILAAVFKKIHRATVIWVGGSHTPKSTHDRVRCIDTCMHGCAGGRVVATLFEILLRRLEILLGLRCVGTSVDRGHRDGL